MVQFRQLARQLARQRARIALGGLLLLSMNAHAEFRAEPVDECSTQILENQNANVLNEMPVTHQGETSLCYAFTAAQMLEYRLRQEGKWNRSGAMNPLWIAINYKGSHSLGIRFNKNKVSNGFLDTALKDAFDLGVCQPEVFDKTWTAYKAGSRLIDADYIYLFEEMWSLREKAKAPDETEDSGFSKVFLAISSQPEYAKIVARIRNENILTHAQFLGEMKAVYARVASVPEEWVKSQKKIEYLRDVVFKSCAPESRIFDGLARPKSSGYFWASNDDLRSKMNELLNDPIPQPIGVGYCSNIYYADDAAAEAGSKRRVLLPRIAKALLSDTKCVSHYSLVTGRRRSPETGACQYLVRNSSGSGFWTKRFECLCRKQGAAGFENCRYDEAKSPSSDRVVGCWIDELPLLNSMREITVLEP